jgi:uncharacterized membrane protein (UPF0127 family)
MPQWIEIRNRSQSNALVVRAKWCESFLCRLRGLTFRRALSERTGLLLVESRESIAGGTIHMFGVFFSLGVIWLDAEKRVVDHTVASPWRIYTPNTPAQYILEGRPEILERVTVGDLLEFCEYEAD